MTSKEWFKQAQFGMMIHWGLYALPAGEWKGQRTPHIGEWLQAEYRIPMKEYERLASAFNPVLFDAEEWVKLAKGCGMQYLVVTSKHHDGFALYHSKVDPYNVYDATPFHRDVLAELAAACAKYDLKLGLYYSQDLDWHEPDGGGYTIGHTNMGGTTSWTNDWDFPDASKKDYSRYLEKKVKPQLKEILTGYGPLCLIWFDTPRTISLQQSQELYDMVKFYQPNCLVNSRIGNGLGDYRSMGDNEIPDQDFLEALVESPTTLNDTWGYKSFDNNWKPADQVRAIRRHLNDRGVNYLLNIGPDALGRIPAPAEAILRELAQP
ncbi:MAG: alpha-L-fucosidase [Oscillospiraceae bacterium]|nr:alpha-L-fucosidase [Oscillospiraceae bacterium]